MKAHIGRSRGRSTPPVNASSGQEWQFHISIVKSHIGRSTGISTPIKSSSGKEWQFKISIVEAYIGRSSGRSAWFIYLPSIEHRCLPYHYTKLGRSTGRSTPLKLSIDALHTITPNLQCIMGYILWDVFGSHFGFFKRGWEFPVISE